VLVTVDNIGPSVSLTAPSAGTVSGTLAISATASDASGIVDVQFRVDGAAIGNGDPTSPYSVSWNSASVTDGSHALTAVARDVAGNITTSAPVTVTVSNWHVPSGLVAAYTFEEGSGTITSDTSGNGHTGTLRTGASWTTSGRFGRALVFNGSSGLVSVADAAALDLTSGLTLEAWVHPFARGNWDTVLMKSAGSTRAYALYSSDNHGRPAGQLSIGSTLRTVDGRSRLPLNTWTHMAVTYGSGRLRLYVNGVLVSSRSFTGSIRTSSDPVTIGGSLAWGRWFAGMIDEVRLYNRELSAAEIQGGMNKTVAH
jgi:hypothetical protein